VVSGRDWRLLGAAGVQAEIGGCWSGGTLEHTKMEAAESGEAYTAQ